MKTPYDPTRLHKTDLAESQFLKHLFNFDISHEVQLFRIASKAEDCKFICQPFQTEISERAMMILYERSQYHKAMYANPGTMDDSYPTALLHFCRQVQRVEKKVITYVDELQDVTKRAREQYALLFRGLMAHGRRPEPPIPVEVDTLFRPGRRVTIWWEVGRGGPVDLDQVSITADDGEDVGDPDEIVPAQHTEADAMKKAMMQAIKFGSFS
ncbi:MAG: hypothetical protein LQ346_004731 [Caloplaca aetnensis]|nr:MAG: hypothetical protein LQ346_004731 [Caloplaca aetnensis]